MKRAKGTGIARTLATRSDALFDLDALPQLMEIDVDAVVPSPTQPRRTVDPDALDDLARSIERHGLLQPIIVHAAEPDGYVLVAGQRRLLAHRILGRQRIAALLAVGRLDELALIENLQREDLSPLDEAEALAGLRARHRYTQDQLATAIAKAKSTVSELLSLNDLPATIKEEVRTSELQLSKSVLIELARIGDDDACRAAWERIKSGGRAVTVRGARAVRQRQAGNDTAALRDRLTKTSQQLLVRLDDLTDDGICLDAKLRGTLQTLHRRLSAILGD